MEKIKKSDLFGYPKIRLFKDDIIYIIELFHYQFGSTLRIELDDFSIQTVAELSNFEEKTTHKFYIRSVTANVSLSLTEKSAYLHLSDIDDVSQLGLKVKIDNLFKKRRRPVNLIANWLFFPYCLFAGIIIGYYLDTIYSIIVLISIILYFLIFIIPSSIFKHTIINLSQSSQDISFFQRNYEKFIVGLIITIFGGIVVLIIWKLIDIFLIG
jgi:hypothetical protein